MAKLLVRQRRLPRILDLPPPIGDTVDAVARGTMAQRTDKDGIRIIATNKKAFHDLEITDKFEAGIQLTGSEVKVLRSGKCVLQGAHVRVVGGEAMVLSMSIPEYPWAHQFGHETDRARRLLLHRREIDRLSDELRSKGTACVVIRVYFKGARVKLELGLGSGKKEHDKRASVKEREAKREIARAIR